MSGERIADADDIEVLHAWVEMKSRTRRAKRRLCDTAEGHVVVEKVQEKYEGEWQQPPHHDDERWAIVPGEFVNVPENPEW